MQFPLSKGNQSIKAKGRFPEYNQQFILQIAEELNLEMIQCPLLHFGSTNYKRLLPICVKSTGKLNID
jgi:hypothetical protein